MCGQICDGTLMPGTGRSWRTRVLHLGMIMREALVGSTAGLDLMATTGQLNRPSLLPVTCLHAFSVRALALSYHVGVVGVAIMCVFCPPRGTIVGPCTPSPTTPLGLHKPHTHMNWKRPSMSFGHKLYGCVV
jgi:hypothetical protein